MFYNKLSLRSCPVDFGQVTISSVTTVLLPRKDQNARVYFPTMDLAQDKTNLTYPISKGLEKFGARCVQTSKSSQAARNTFLS